LNTYLGVDGGGSKTQVVLIDANGRVLAQHEDGPAYHLEIGLEALQEMLERAIGLVLERGGVRKADLSFAFVGLPAYGEDSALLPRLDALPSAALPAGRYRCGNDMICGWAGALAGADGINVVAGTGSMAYGEWRGRHARSGGWGELFSDEGSAHWLAREGLRLFSRMSDGRMPRGLLYTRVREHFELHEDLDLCAAIYGRDVARRSRLAQLSRVVAEAASSGDTAALALFTQATSEFVEMVEAVRHQLAVPAGIELPVACTGGLSRLRDLILVPLERALARSRHPYRLMSAVMPPAAGAALYAAKLCGHPLDGPATEALGSRWRSTSFDSA